MLVRGAAGVGYRGNEEGRETFVGGCGRADLRGGPAPRVGGQSSKLTKAALCKQKGEGPGAEEQGEKREKVTCTKIVCMCVCAWRGAVFRELPVKVGSRQTQG